MERWGIWVLMPEGNGLPQPSGHPAGRIDPYRVLWMATSKLDPYPYRQGCSWDGSLCSPYGSGLRGLGLLSEVAGPWTDGCHLKPRLCSMQLQSHTSRISELAASHARVAPFKMVELEGWWHVLTSSKTEDFLLWVFYLVKRSNCHNSSACNFCASVI